MVESQQLLLRARATRQRQQNQTYIVFIGEAKEFANLCRALRAEALRVDNVSEAGDFTLALLDDAERHDGQVGGGDAAADGFATTLAVATCSVAGVAVREEEANAIRTEDALLHWEALLVVAAGDFDNVALPLVAESVGGDLGAHL